jgi:thioredoxin reductase (NADPH)
MKWPSQQAVMNHLRKTFASFKYPIDVYLFSSPAKDDVFAQANRQVIRAFRELTDKISFREFGLDHEYARKWGVSDVPTLVIAPEQYNIHWLGAPMGEEGRTFLELLLHVGDS